MAKNSNILILDDAYFENVRRYISDTTESADLKIEVMIRELEDVLANGIIEGETSKVLRTYLNRLNALRSTIYDVGRDYSEKLKNFKKAIDDIDKMLY